MYRFKMLINEEMISRVAHAGTSPAPGYILRLRACPCRTTGHQAICRRRRGEILKTFISHSREETLRFGESIGKAAPDGAVIAFKGDLGAGKTTLSKGIARGLGIVEELTSPTYTIVSEYAGRLTLFHMDAYRLGGSADFAEIGGPEMLETPGSLCLVEWSERLPEIAGGRTAVVEIRVMDDGARRFSLSGTWLEALLP